MVRPLEGKIVLVTGGGSRLGHAMALGLGRAGADVAVHFHQSSQGAKKACETIRVDGNRSETFGANLRSVDDILKLVDGVYETFGRIDALVNNAAVFERAPFIETAVESLDRQWGLNARAPFLLAQHIGRRMVGHGGGDIVNILDVGGNGRTWPGYSAYTMTKAALGALTECLAVELAPHIRVNGIAPGTVLPPSSMDAATRERIADRTPQKRLGNPEDVVETLLFLLTGPKFVTGQIVAVDGGRSLVG